MKTVFFALAGMVIVVGCRSAKALGQGSKQKPNIVVIMGDDWSWPHASILGDVVVKTPTFDRIAREGVLFNSAFASAPSCTPSRFAVLTGQYHWRLKEGDSLGGSLARDVPVYSDLLTEVGYHIGFSRKGASPSRHKYRGADPLGPRFRNFDQFLAKRKLNQPFCYWYGAGEPHRPYDWKASQGHPTMLAKIKIPPFLPDNDIVRTDLGDYYLRVQKLDEFAGKIVDRLQQDGLLENTLLIMTSDNGMPFPRAKATLFDSGTRVPLAIRWGNRIQPSRNIHELVGLTDLAPTILEAAGLPVPRVMNGRSLLPLLTTQISTKPRQHVLTGMERHVYPWPSRAIRTANYLYVRNYDPQQWPTGQILGPPRTYDFNETPWPVKPGAFSFNTDPGPTKQWMLKNPSGVNEQAFGRHPKEELYDLKKDPHQLRNLASDPNHASMLGKLSRQLTKELIGSGDPRNKTSIR